MYPNLLVIPPPSPLHISLVYMVPNLFVMAPSFHRNKYDDFKLYGTHVAKSLCHVHSAPNRNKHHDFIQYSVHVDKSFRHVPSPIAISIMNLNYIVLM